DRSYRKRGIDIFTGARLEKADVGKSNVKLHVKGGDGKTNEITVDVALVAVGRAPIIDEIGLDRAGVKTDRGFIVVDDNLRTTAANVYAIGDVAKPPLLAHKASHEGIAVVEHNAGVGHGVVDYGNIPRVPYYYRQAANVGLPAAAITVSGSEVGV